jgi:glycosyltransferase involved in cell wall biosynthesis
VALATYNGALYLAEQLASLTAQTRLPDELVVSDDASTDATIDCLERFAAAAPFPVRIYRNETRLGFRANFMKAMALCRFDLIALCDQDDIWDPQKLAVAKAAFDTPDIVLFFHNAWLVDEHRRRLGPADIYRLPPVTPPLTIDAMENPFGFSIVFDRSLLQFTDLWTQSADTMEPDERMAHDQWLFFLASVFGTICYSDQHLTEYRQHATNACGFSRDDSLSGVVRHRLRWLRNYAACYVKLARVSRVRAMILRESTPRLEGSWLDRCVAAERALMLKSDQMSLRAELYNTQSSALHRVGVVLKLLRKGAYVPGGWTLGRAALAKDLIFGVLLKPVLTPEHRSETV